jgi:IS1 family transposase
MKCLSEAGRQKVEEIEMDEIYTYVKKLQRAVIWTAYRRRQKCVITYEISNEGISSCLRI